jgi:hypothetical protein
MRPVLFIEPVLIRFCALLRSARMTRNRPAKTARAKWVPVSVKVFKALVAIDLIATIAISL